MGDRGFKILLRLIIAAKVMSIPYVLSSCTCDEPLKQIIPSMPLNHAHQNRLIQRSDGGRSDRKKRFMGCPVRPVSCDPNAEYRTSDGTCNNLADPLAGSNGMPFKRLLPSDYGDGISTPRGTGKDPPLPTPRQVSNALNAATERNNSIPVTMQFMTFGQFISHDFAFTPEVDLGGISCCDNGTNPVSASPECMPLDVTGDPFYSKFGITCLSFVRSLPADPSFTPGPRQQVNNLTAFMDGSQIYGSSTAQQLGLRTLVDGKLKIGPGMEQDAPCPATSSCPFTFLPIRLKKGVDEFFAGDGRVEEQPGLVSMHVLFMRAHNGLVEKLKMQHSDWSDEKLFQEIRKIIGAILQQITYEEYLPLALGESYVNTHNLRPFPPGHQEYSEYFSDIDPSVPNSFATAAFRFGHSMIGDEIHLENDIIVELARSFNIHPVTTIPGRYPSQLLRAMSVIPATGMDQTLAKSVSNKLTAKSPFDFGSDLYAKNIMRGRDHGLPSYPKWRQYCNRSALTCFNQLNCIMGLSAASAFKSVYGSVDDIDLYPALIAERTVEGQLLGPTVTCLLGEYFYKLKFGDRYWFENDAHANPFSFRQLNSIHRTTFAAMICAFTPTPRIQRFVFLPPGPGNRVLNCSSILKNTIPETISTLF